MSQIEGLSKPIITEMALGRSRTLEDDDLAILSRWAIKTAIVNNLSGKNEVVTSIQERQFVMNNFYPPDGWQVVIARNLGKQYNRNVAYYVAGFHNEDSLKKDVDPPPFAHSTVITIGQLAILVIGTPHPIAAAQLRVPEVFHCNHRIWPPPAKPFQWPSRPATDDQGVRNLIDALYISLTQMGLKLPSKPSLP